MERLTERDFRLGFDDSNKLPSYEAVYERLREYENAEQDGRLPELPCKVGDIVHFIDDIDGVYERSAVVAGIEIDTEGVHIVIPDDETGSVSSYYAPEEFGETIFLTKEAAEAALKEMEGQA